MNRPDQERLIAVPARTRVEIGELGSYLEQTVRSLREVSAHLHGSPETTPGVLHELRAINSLTEAATVRVLEQTEALVDDGRQAVALLGDAERAMAAGAPVPATERLAEVRGLVTGASDRAFAIMSALEFQDLTSQRVERLFSVLQEVVRRLARIQSLVDLGQDDREEPGPPPAVTATTGKSGQALADELFEGFER